MNSKSLQEITERERDNRYAFLMNEASEAYLATQRGEVAYDFTAERTDGSEINLSDYRGKIVFIDNWASWCGPCIAARPQLKEMTTRLEGSNDIVFLYISVDERKSDWIDFLKKEESPIDDQSELFIKKGMSTDYGKNYNIKFIPKYVLIDREGLLVDSNMKNLVESERQIKKLLQERY